MKKPLLIVAKLIITTLVVWWVLHKLGPDGLQKLGANVRAADPRGLALGVFFVFLTMGIGVCRWQCLLRVQGIRLSNYQAVWITAVGLFFNAFLIGATGGDVLKAWYAAAAAPGRKPQAVLSVIVDRLVGLLGLFLLATFAVLANWRVLMEHRETQPIAFLVVGALLAAIVTLILSAQRRRLAAHPWWQRIQRMLPAQNLLKQLAESYDVYGRYPRTLALTLLLSLGVHVTSVLAAWAIGEAIPIRGVTLAHYFVYCPLINAFAAIPITLSGLGLRENAYTFFFALQQVPGAAAVALSLLFYAATLVVSLLSGILYLVGKPKNLGAAPATPG